MCYLLSIKKMKEFDSSKKLLGLALTQRKALGECDKYKNPLTS